MHWHICIFLLTSVRVGRVPYKQVRYYLCTSVQCTSQYILVILKFCLMKKCVRSLLFCTERSIKRYRNFFSRFVKTALL